MSLKKTLSEGIRPILIGFFLGFAVLLILYASVFHITGHEFTFSYIWQFHSRSLYMYLIDSLPFTGVLLAIIIFIRNKREKEKLKQQILKERERKLSAIIYLEDLKTGRFSDKFHGERDNELLISLDELRYTLQENHEDEELRKKEDNQRNWASEGLAMFGDILRQPGENMEDFAYVLISKLVKYLEANQGGFFTVEDEINSLKHIQMLACYAYDRRKFADKKIEWGTGIIGTCVLEKKSIFISDLPDNYLLITSGLGKATPDYLLLVPLISGEEVHGVLEIASFRKLEDYQLTFCEKVAEDIAMTLSSIKSNARTSLLLKETRAQAEELVLQEEKMRLNMDELKATQELAASQAEKFISFTNSVNHTLIRAEYDKDGILLYANTRFLKKMGFSGNREVEGRHISTFIHEKDRDWFNTIWNGLAKGGEHFEGYMKHITKQGLDIWTMATYTCVREEDGTVEKVLFLAIDTTEYKKQSLDYEGQIEAINKLNLKAEFKPDGKLISSNELFNNSLNYTQRELTLKSIFDFFDRRDLENFVDIWEEVIRGIAYQGQLRLNTRLDQEKWFRTTFSSVNDMYGEVSKVVFLANEITNERLMELESRKQNEQLKLQEEKLRFAGMELERKMEEVQKKWTFKLNSLQEKLQLLEKINDNLDVLIFSIDNSGNLVYINEHACKYWKLRKKDINGQPASLIFEVSNNSYPDFFVNLTDPARAKKDDREPIIIPGADNKEYKFSPRLYTLNQNEKIIYTAFLTRLN